MFGKDIGIDLGTANTLVFMKGKGIIMREPSVVAVDTRNYTVKYVGQEAKDVIGRTPGSIVAVRPLKDGVIADFDITASMLQIFIKKACNNSIFARPRVVICIPSGVTAVERRAASLPPVRSESAAMSSTRQSFSMSRKNITCSSATAPQKISRFRLVRHTLMRMNSRWKSKDATWWTVCQRT